MAAAAAGQKEPRNIVSEWVAEHGAAGTLETERLVNYQNKQGDTALHLQLVRASFCSASIRVAKKDKEQGGTNSSI